MKRILLITLYMAVPSLLLAAESANLSVSASNRALLDQYCVICHNQAMVNSVATANEGLQTTQLRNLGLTLDTEDVSNLTANPQVWEKVINKLRVGVMPPPNYPRPDKVSYDGFRAWLENELDRIAASQVNPGRTQAFHRLNQTEYRNSIRDLLDLDMDVSDLIPADAPDQYGFDNNAEVLALSPLSVERYVSAAHKVAELAVGASPRGSSVKTYDVPLNLIQDDRLSEELPFGSRGGTAIEHLFPVDGEYRITVKLQTNDVDFVRGYDEAHEMELSLDGEYLQTYAFGGDAPGMPAPYGYAGNVRGSDDWEEFMMAFADQGFEFVLPIKAGPRVIGATFPREMWEAEGVQQPRLFGYHLAVNEMPDANHSIGSIAIEGPLSVEGPGDTPSRQQIFSCQPASADEEPVCARQILSSLARRAYRRPIDESDVQGLMDFYNQGYVEGGFVAGIQFALERLLVSPDFLFRIEQDPLARALDRYGRPHRDGLRWQYADGQGGGGCQRHRVAGPAQGTEEQGQRLPTWDLG